MLKAIITLEKMVPFGLIFLQALFLKDPIALYEKEWLKPCCTPLKRPCSGATWQTPTPSLPGDHARQVEKRTGLSYIVILSHEHAPWWVLRSSLGDNNLKQKTYQKIPTPWPPLVLHTPPEMYSPSLGELSTQAVQRSAVHLGSLLRSTAYRIYWLLKTDSCWEDDTIIMQLSQLWM